MAGSIITQSITSRQNGPNFSDNFLVIIKSTNTQGNGTGGYTVVARVPESIQMQLASEWDTPLSQGSGNAILEVAAQNFLGVSTKAQFSSAQIWGGSSPLEITIPLEFYAESNARDEVVTPIVQLARMALPRLSGNTPGGLFIPPGPKIFPEFLNSSASGEDKITIIIGKFLYFTDVIVLSVNPTWSTKDMSQDGYPLKAECELTFRTVFTLTGSELEAKFK